MLKELIKLANHLDKKGFRKEADNLDKIISRANSLSILETSSFDEDIKFDKHMEIDGYFMDEYIGKEEMNRLHKKVEMISSQEDLEDLEMDIVSTLEREEAKSLNKYEEEPLELGEEMGQGRSIETEEEVEEKNEPIPGSLLISSSHDKSTGRNEYVYKLDGETYKVVTYDK